MTLEEVRIMRQVQAILVRNYVDTQKLNVEVIGASVYLEGDLQIFEYNPAYRKMDRVERDLSQARMLLHIEKQIRSMAEIAHIEFKLRNWDRVGAQWVPRRH